MVWLDAIYGVALVLGASKVISQNWKETFVHIPNLHFDTTPASDAALAAAPAQPAADSRAGQVRAVQLYPDLAKAHSKLNDEFVRRYQQYRKVNPGYFNNPEWPTRLAHESQSALAGH